MGLEVLFPVVGRCTAPVKTINIDDWYAQFNRVFMFYLSLTFAVVLTIRQLLGGPSIACDGFPPQRERFAEDWCWARGIYTLKEAYDMKSVVSPYPGIVPEDIPACMEYQLMNGSKIKCPKSHEVKPFTRIYHTWYPFVMFYFWMTSAFFFFPYKMYKLWGFNRLKEIIDLLQNPVEDGKEKKELIRRGCVWLYLQTSVCLNQHSLYSSLTVAHRLGIVATAVKMLYLIVSASTIYMTQKMFKFDSFYKYGLLWEGSTPLNNMRSLIQEKLFPKVAACELKRYGTTGMEVDKGMCMLGINMLNQYIFLMYWFFLFTSLLLNLITFLITLAKLMLPWFHLNSFLVNSGLQKHKSLPTIRKLYFGSGSSLRFILEVLSANLDRKLLAELCVQLFAMISDELRIRRHQREQEESASPLLKIGRGIQNRVRKIRRSGEQARSSGDTSRDNLPPPQGRKERSGSLGIPMVLINDEIVSLRSEQCR